MDQIYRRLVSDATDAFIASIDCSKICDLASTFHPQGKPCRVFREPKKGSYNVCFFIVFLSDEGDTDTDEKWVIRLPLIPRLAFPEEKMRSEIATMKCHSSFTLYRASKLTTISRYIASKTSIPIPHLHGYGFRQTHPSGLTFMLISFITGDSLADYNLPTLDPPLLSHLYTQLADIFIQLRHCEFPYIGSLTLDPIDDQTPIFLHNRALSIDINDHELGGLSPTSIIGPSKIYTTAIDYIYAQTQLLFNQFDKQQNSVYHEADARYHLYGLHQFRSILMGWLRREYNEGPFILIHGDFRRANVLVDQNLNITGVLDWEWSRTVPVQMFLPPPWLRGSDIRDLLGIRGLGYGSHLANFRDVVKAKEKEKEMHCQGSSREEKIPLSKLWDGIYNLSNFLIGQALLRLDVAGDVYWDNLDRRYFGNDAEARVKLFYEVSATSNQKGVIERKLQELEMYNAKLKEQGLEEDKPLEPFRGLPPDKVQELIKHLRNFNNREEAKRHEIWSWSWFRSRTGLDWRYVIQHLH
jgi:Phosphotransferase enzyme family